LAAKYARGVKLPTVLRKKAPSLPFTSLSNSLAHQIQLQSFQGAGATAALLVYLKGLSATSLALRCYFTSSPTISVVTTGTATASSCVVALPNAQLYYYCSDSQFHWHWQCH